MSTPAKKKLGLLPKLIIAIVLGLIVGTLARKFDFPIIIRIGATFNSIFGNFLGFCIPLIIIGFVAPGIADLGSGAGKTLALTAGVAYLSTVEMPPLMGVMTALITSFIMGIGIAVTRADNLRNIFHEFQKIVEGVVAGVLIPLLPFHIYGIFANMTYAGTVAEIMSVFAKVFVIIIAMHLLIIVFQYVVAGTVSKKNPFLMIKNMIPAYMTAIGTQSSAATIPVTLECTKKNGCDEKIADFVVPLCATIHLSGSTITLTSCAIAVMMLNGWSVSFTQMIPFVMMLGITMVAAPGVPGGAVMAALGILESMLGFNDNMLTLMIALYIAQDSFGTACNVTGDGAIAMLMNAINRKKKTA